MLKNSLQAEQTVQKKASCFFRELQLITVLLLICVRLKVRLFKTMRGISHFRFRFDFIKVYIIVQQNA